MSRIETLERIYLGEDLKPPQLVSRIDKLWAAINNGETVLLCKPVTRGEEYLAHMIDSSVVIRTPQTCLEKMLYAIATGGKVDAATKAAICDEYLKYIYEMASGENMFVANASPGNVEGVTFSDRVIKFNGTIAGLTKLQGYRKTPVAVGETVTLRYKYKGGSITGDGWATFNPSYVGTDGNHAWATAETLAISATDYTKDKAIVTTVENALSAFLVGVENNLTFDRFECEIAFEKGDTTQ